MARGSGSARALRSFCVAYTELRAAAANRRPVLVVGIRGSEVLGLLPTRQGRDRVCFPRRHSAASISTSWDWNYLLWTDWSGTHYVPSNMGANSLRERPYGEPHDALTVVLSYPGGLMVFVVEIDWSTELRGACLANR